MLEIRPNCEICDKDLPPDSREARICSHECTYCADCAETILHDVCPNCGGGLCPRPIRPATEWRPGEHLGAHPANSRRRHTKWSRAEIAEIVERLRGIPPHLR
ncbi:MAG: DUF1272 domain-containing protein [Hyphomicrobiaceae bacterium]|nr:DUF1272 domain-containing protein [Hyphomicrobiaceae bacterium]